MLHGCRFVWDPFTESLRNEFYDCSRDGMAFEETWTTDAGPSFPQSHVNSAAVVTWWGQLPKRVVLADEHSAHEGNALTLE